MDISQLPTGDAKKALSYDYFPTRFQAVIFRNFNIVPLDNIANVLQCSVAQVISSANDMGLKYDGKLEKVWMERGFLTILQSNWHLLNYPQLLKLLDWDADKLDFILREEDFAWVKLGMVKPIVEDCYYTELNSNQKQQTAKIKSLVENNLKFIAQYEEEKPFDFLNLVPPVGELKFPDQTNLRLLYSYSAPCGDPLLDEKLDPYPDNMLECYAKQGVNAVWFQGILYTLVPYLGDIEISQHWQKRIENLKKLVARAAKYGIKIYLYLNEPRAIPKRYFVNFPEMGGSITSNDNLQAFCPQNKELLEKLKNGIKTLCTQVPDIGGFFTITMSENLTHCLSRPNDNLSYTCPHCENPADNISKILNAIYQGISESPSQAKLTAWSWAWNDSWALDLLKKLNKNIKIMCVSETNVETDSYGVKGSVIDYSISKVGPGNLAKDMWALAQKSGHSCVAKIQINCTWEMSAVPYIPVFQLVKKHLNNLKDINVNDYMLGWTLGGFPGGNLELLNLSIEELCLKKYGSLDVAKATEYFSQGFSLFPFNNVSLIYNGPQNIGAANLLYLEKSNYSSTMVKGFPYDDIDTWRGNHYPVANLERAFTEMCEYWEKGLDILNNISVSSDYQKDFDDLKLVSEAVYCHLASSLNQIRFIIARDNKDNKKILEITKQEIAITQRQWACVALDSRIGFEAANHYYYNSNTFLEKLLNCQYIVERVK